MRKMIAAGALAVALSVAPSAGWAQASAQSRGVDQTTRLEADLGTLQAILIDVQRDTDMTVEKWRVIANEAMMLANRVNARTTWMANRTANRDLRDAATQLRHHVVEMRRSLQRSQTAEARTHAAAALPFTGIIGDAIS
jgi:hypothetical protein